MKKLLTLPEVAKVLGFKERTIYLWSQEGRLPSFKIGTTWRYRSDEIDAWLENHRASELTKPEDKIDRLLMHEDGDPVGSDSPLDKPGKLRVSGDHWNSSVPGIRLSASARWYTRWLAPSHALMNRLRHLAARLKSVFRNRDGDVNSEPGLQKADRLSPAVEDSLTPASRQVIIGGPPSSGATVSNILEHNQYLKNYLPKTYSSHKEDLVDRSGKPAYRSGFAQFQSDRTRILEVLSDGNGRGLFEIAQAIWEIDSDSDPEYGLIRKSLASTLSREVNSKPQNLFRWGRGRFSTRRYEKPVWAIKRAIHYDLIDLTQIIVDMEALYEAIQESRGEHVSGVIFSPDNELADALFNFQAFGMQGSDPSGRKVSKINLDSTLVDYFNRHVSVDLLAVPVLAVESQLVRRRGKELIFDEQDLATVSKAWNMSSAGSKAWSARTAGKARFLYDPNSEVIEFLNAHESVRKEITAVIAFRALMYIFGADVDRRNASANTALHLAATEASLEVARLMLDKHLGKNSDRETLSEKLP